MTVFCTLSRTLPAPGKQRVEEAASAPQDSSAAVIDNQRKPPHVARHYGLAGEVVELWSLLASLLSLGSPPFEVGVSRRRSVKQSGEKSAKTR